MGRGRNDGRWGRDGTQSRRGEVIRTGSIVAIVVMVGEQDGRGTRQDAPVTVAAPSAA